MTCTDYYFQQGEEDEDWLDDDDVGDGANIANTGADSELSVVKVTEGDKENIVEMLKLQLEEAQAHNQIIQEEMMSLKSQWELLAQEREDKLQSELELRLEEATERLDLEEKVDAGWREIRRYQDTLQHSQEQLQAAQQMIEEAQQRQMSTQEKYLAATRRIRTDECLYRLVADQLKERDRLYKAFILSLIKVDCINSLPTLNRILKKQPVQCFIPFNHIFLIPCVFSTYLRCLLMLSRRRRNMTEAWTLAWTLSTDRRI